MSHCLTPFDISVQTYTANSVVPLAEKCNGYTITNLGTDVVTVENMVLYPGTPGTVLGDSRTVGGHACEILQKKSLTVSFTTLTGPKLEIIQKYYL